MALCLAALGALALPARAQPHLGYLYPAGGRQGTVVQVAAGGQQLMNAQRVIVSGEGVHAQVVRTVPPLKFGGKRLQDEIAERLRAVRDGLETDMGAVPLGAIPPFMAGGSAAPPAAVSSPAGSPQAMVPVPSPSGSAPAMMTATGGTLGIAPPGQYKPPPATEDSLEAAMLDFPILSDLDHMTPAELRYVARSFRRPSRRQNNPQLAQTAILRFTIDAGAAPGDREVRLLTPAGLTNPMCFQVGARPELMEREPNDPDSPRSQRVEPPVVLNGQIMPGDVDCYRFQAAGGTTIVAAAQARALNPFLADAVPGWFEAVLTLYDPAGVEVAFAGTGLAPDPMLRHAVTGAGEYRLEIRDALYRGRQDFVYRVVLEERPAADAVVPAGAARGAAPAGAVAASASAAAGDAPDGAPSGEAGPEEPARPVHPDLPATSDRLSRPAPWARVDVIPECKEIEPNDDGASAQPVSLPCSIQGVIDRPGDVDVFKFEGRAGQTIVAEVTARRAGSPLDSLLRLSDASARVLAWNDDHKDVDAGMETHQADSYLSVALPSAGTYFVRISDAQRHGGDAYRYRLRISEPIPDFAVFVTPSSVNMVPAPAVVLGLRAVRRDGFDGDIQVDFAGDAHGFSLAGNRIPRGRDSVSMTLSSPEGPIDPPVSLSFLARARIAGQDMSRPVIPAEELTEAFLNKHLMPSGALMVAGRGHGRLASLIRFGSPLPVRIAPGASVPFLVSVPFTPAIRGVHLELRDPPKGMSLGAVSVVPQGLSLELKASAKDPPIGYADNLIVEVFWERPAAARDGKPAGPGARAPRGVLPAIPFEIVRP